ncbi:hypothetical protein G7Y79_00064g094090 [Physcia stellaris]|nr:hypothetical protein G7Y79_00064g094090 [Physcia stellaris]
MVSELTGEASRRRALANQAALFNSGKYSDLTITCKSSEWHVHRNVEANEGKINLPEDNPEIVDLVLQYIYKLDYDDEGHTAIETATDDVHGKSSSAQSLDDRFWSSIAVTGKAALEGGDTVAAESLEPVEECSSSSRVRDLKQIHASLLINLRVYALADKYHIRELMDLAAAKFKSHINIWPLHDFPAIVSEIVDLTPANDRGLRPVIVDICTDHLKEVLNIKSAGADSFEGEENDETTQWTMAITKDIDLIHAILKSGTMKLLDTIHEREVANAQVATAMEGILEGLQKALEEKNQIQNDFHGYENRVDNLLRAAMRDRCRHCNTVFIPMFEETYRAPGRIGRVLRCSGCRTRHDY